MKITNYLRYGLRDTFRALWRHKGDGRRDGAYGGDYLYGAGGGGADFR